MQVRYVQTINRLDARSRGFLFIQFDNHLTLNYLCRMTVGSAEVSAVHQHHSFYLSTT